MATPYLPVNPLSGGVTRPSPLLGQLLDPVDRQISGRTQHIQPPNIPMAPAPATAQAPVVPVNPTEGGEEEASQGRFLDFLMRPNISPALLAAGSAMLQQPGNFGQGVGAGARSGTEAFLNLEQQDRNNEARETQLGFQERQVKTQEERTLLEKQQEERVALQSEKELKLRARQLGIQENSEQFNQLIELRKLGLDEELLELRKKSAEIEQAYGNINTPQAGIASLITESWVTSGAIDASERTLFMPDALEMAAKYFQDEDTKSTINDMVKSYVGGLADRLGGLDMNMTADDLRAQGIDIANLATSFQNLLTNTTGREANRQVLSSGLGTDVIHQRRGDTELRRGLQQLGARWEDLDPTTRTNLLVRIKQLYPEWNASQWEAEAEAAQ